jgi:hypothetical protein
MSIKSAIRNVLGESNMGRLDYIRNPGLRQSWGGPFNGQQFRQQIFDELIRHLRISAIVETGTYRGTTTAAFAATGLPVYTVEGHPRYFAYSQMRFLLNSGRVHVYMNDSRAFLRTLSANTSVPREGVLFYLDAHWEDDLPLREELEIVFSRWAHPLVMIDDFKVPDSDYGFDDYGVGKTLDLSYIDPVISAYRLFVYFPKAPASDETGSRRGCAVLCDANTRSRLDALVTTLVRYA